MEEAKQLDAPKQNSHLKAKPSIKIQKLNLEALEIQSKNFDKSGCPETAVVKTDEKYNYPFSALQPLMSQTERGSRNQITVLEANSKVESIEILG